MKKAKFKLDFEAETYFDIDREMKVALPDGSRIVFKKSKGKNQGTIFFELNQPNEVIARNYGQSKVEEIFSYLLVTKDNFENWKPIYFPQKPKLLNPEIFIGLRKTGYVTLKASTVLVTKLDQQELDIVNNLLIKVDKLPENIQEIIFRSLHWFRKASETNGEDRFIYRWVSFEALWGLVKEEKPSVFLNQYLITPVANTILEKHKKTIIELSNANLISWKGAKRSEKLRGLLKRDKKPAKDILIKVEDCIYEVRNKFLHTGKALELIKGSSSLLRDLIRESLKEYVQKSRI